jgi:hypothetical protein
MGVDGRNSVENAQNVRTDASPRSGLRLENTELCRPVWARAAVSLSQKTSDFLTVCQVSALEDMLNPPAFRFRRERTITSKQPCEC